MTRTMLHTRRGGRTAIYRGRTGGIGRSTVVGGRGNQRYVYASKTRTGTRTKTKTKLNQGTKANALQTGSLSGALYKSNMLTKFKYKEAYNLENYCYNYNYASTWSAGIGAQEFALTNWIYTYNPTSALYGQLCQNTAIQNRTQSFFSTSNKLSLHVIPWEVTARTEYVNAANAPCTLTLYDIVSRKQSSITSRADPLEMVQNNMDQEGDTNNDYQTVGYSPFQSKSFCQNYKIIKVTTAHLAEGQVHVHTFRHLRKEMLPIGLALEECTDSGIWTNMRRGLSAWTLACVAGSPVASATNPLTEVSTSACKINYMTKWSYVLKIPSPNDKAINNSSNGLSTSLTGGAIVMQMYSGADQAANTA